VGKRLCFPEVLGKNSEVERGLKEGDIKLVSSDQEDVANFERLQLATGYNPFKDAEAL